MRFIVLLGAALALASPASAASVQDASPAGRPGVAPVQLAQVQLAQVQLAQVIIRERYRDDWRPGWRRGWRDGRRWDGYTGQVCRTRVVYRTNRWGERVRRVIRTCD